MVEPTKTSPMAGFTLAEMLAALGILLFGVTALLGALASSIGLRRTADARHELTALCEYAVHRVVHDCVKSSNDRATPFDVEFVPLVDQTAPGFPGMKWSAKAVVDETRPTLWLVTIDVRWLDAGEEVVAQFLRVVPRQLPLGARVLTFRGEGQDTVKR